VTFGGESGWFGALRAAISAASADRGRQRAFAGVADLQCARGLQIRQWLRLQLDVLNLFNAKTNQIEYYYLSRLPASRSAAWRTGMCIRQSRWRCG
jgi:hypothetical protein